MQAIALNNNFHLKSSFKLTEERKILFYPIKNFSIPLKLQFIILSNYNTVYD